MAHWKKEKKEKIRQLLEDNDCKAFFVGFNNGRSTKSFYMDDIKDKDIILGYNLKNDIYYVWNAQIHIYNSYVTAPNKAINDIYTCYSSIHDGKGSCEKKLIIKEKRIEYFCNHWIDLLIPNEEDIKCIYDKNILWKNRFEEKEIIFNLDNFNNKIIREKYIFERYKRNSEFSEKVKNNYNNMCAVCRCSIPELLEAAHIIAVKDFGNDSLSNGICLCRNHHVLYDRGILKLNGDFTFSTDNELLKNDIYYKQALEKYHGKLLKPNNKTE